MPALELVLLLLFAAVIGVVGFRLLHLPPMLGYLAVGILIGPHALRWIQDAPDTRYLAEFGVVFLMFSIGLEFNLPKLKSMRHLVFGLGLAQVGLTVALAMAAAWLAHAWIPVTWQGALALGGALAMSSTAIVSKMLTERLELESPHGRQIMGVLLFQDLALVPLLIVVQTLATDPKNLLLALSVAALKAVVVLALLLIFGQRAMRAWFHVVARRRSQELFMLNLLLITLGLAWVTDLAGLSLALGAFIAGVLISETEYRHQVEEDIKPFRDVLLGLFFVTIGMLLDVRTLVNQAPLVALLLLVPVLAKFALIAFLSRIFGSAPGVAIRTGLALAQAGEFGFVLLNQAGGLRLVDPLLVQAVLASMLLSMLIAPFLIQYSDRIVMRLASSEWMLQSLELTKIAARAMATERHVIICGYGRSGQHLARFLDKEQRQYVALDLDPDRVREAAAAGESVVFGDAARKEALIAAGIHRAAALVVTYADTASALKVLHFAHELEPNLAVIVRTHDDADLEKLQQAGAAEVVPEILEGSLMLASQTLLLLGVPIRRVVENIRVARYARYRMLRGVFHGADDVAPDLGDQEQVRLHSVPIPPTAPVVGQSLGRLGLELMGVEVTAIRRRDIRGLDPGPETVLASGDIVVLRGAPEALSLAEERLLAS